MQRKQMSRVLHLSEGQRRSTDGNGLKAQRPNSSLASVINYKLAGLE